MLSAGIFYGFGVAQPRSVGVRGRGTRLFAKRKCRASLVYKQSYGSFEMVLSPRSEAKQVYGCFEIVLFPAKTAKL